MSERFADQVVLVTGAGGGQGAAEARQFAAEGAKVIIADILDDQGTALAEEINASGGQAIYHRLDVSDAAAWRDAETMIASRFKALHVLVNNAGVAFRRPLVDTELADWERILSVNLTGPFLGLRTLAPLIRDSGGGAVINTGSIAGMIGHFATAYSTSKWGLRGLTKSAAMEFAKWNIRVNAIHPGIVDTPIVAGADDFIEAMEWMTPLGRSASSEEMARVVAFLASSDASFITGLDINADGGFAELGAYWKVYERAQNSPQAKL